MSTKATIASGITGAVSPDTYKFTVVTPANFLAVCVDGMNTTDKLRLLRRDAGGTAWAPYTDGTSAVVISPINTHVIPTKPGEYGLSGSVSGTITIFTEAI